MGGLKVEKLHVRFLPGSTPAGPLFPRRYTLTHSDRTGDLFLTIGPDYNRKQLSGLYTRLLRDEALAEWANEETGPTLHVYVHVSGGFVFGSPAWRNRILKREMPRVLEAIRVADAYLIAHTPRLVDAPIVVHFESHKAKYHRVEPYGNLRDYELTRPL